MCPPCLSLCFISFPLSVRCHAAALFLTVRRGVCAKSVCVCETVHDSVHADLED